jgi:chlorite dismutase
MPRGGSLADITSQSAMAEPTAETLNHFATLRFTSAYWELPAEARARVRNAWLAAHRGAADAVHLYQVAALEASADLLVWSAIASAEPAAVDRFFAEMAAALGPARQYVSVVETLWGFTRPSAYTKTRSTQELDPFEGERRPFLIVYPFVKTAEWYQLGRDARQQLMAGHIKTGTQYKDITQLLLYSFGLQDQEFVVAYETDDLRRFLALVNDLRATDARPYTARDWPLHTGRLVANAAALDAWL